MTAPTARAMTGSTSETLKWGPIASGTGRLEPEIGRQLTRRAPEGGAVKSSNDR